MVFGSLIQMKLLILFVLSLASLAYCEEQDDRLPSSHLSNRSLRVLLLSLPFVGHMTPLLSLADELVSRGHMVTMCVGASEDTFQKLKKQIEDSHAIYHSFQNSFISLPPLPEQAGIIDIGSKMINAFRNVSLYSLNMLQSLNQSLTNGSYDIIIGNDFMMHVAMCIGSRWKVPVIIVAAGMQILPHHYPPWPWSGVLQAPASENLSFLQRMIGLMVFPLDAIVYKQFLMTAFKSVIQDFCPQATLAELSTASGIYVPHIVPTVIGFEYPRTLTPLCEYVGPLVPRHPKPLSQNMALKQWLESCPESGVVYLSMGSRYSPTPEMGKALLEGVMQTNYSLLWSLKNGSHWILDGLKINPERVFISEWTPQFSVLASKAIHSTIMHGGFNGLNEALFHGVPVIGLPQMKEQELNLGRLFHNGLGLKLDANSLDSSTVAQAIASLNGGEFRQRIGKLQKMFKLAGGVKRAADLVEFYEENGYSHLVPAYAKYQWSWVHYYNVDVWLVVVCVLLLLVYVDIKLLVFVKHCCCKKKQKTE